MVTIFVLICYSFEGIIVDSLEAKEAILRCALIWYTYIAYLGIQLPS